MNIKDLGVKRYHMKCCKECKTIKVKDCEYNPCKCMDLYLANKKQIDLGEHNDQIHDKAL